ncbi:uncharacterized protein LOC143465031 [Clavelina lepadiformis]|uniref:uncharacterized protein LOC143465031 n=1 Tax=Clavelina lepadiformis TaxID=159417 RepID=UPI0040413ABE
MNRKVKLQVSELHAHLTCSLCQGYFVDAATIIECLHSFCRTCIVNYLSNSKSCPVCHVQVHKTRPLLNIRHDQTLQDIVYKLVPGLRSEEMHRRKAFWEEYKDQESWKTLTPEKLGITDQSAWNNKMGKVYLSLEKHQRNANTLPPSSEWKEIDRQMTKRYIRCCSDVTVLHIQKFVKMKLKECDDVEVLIFFGENILPQSFTLSDVFENFPCPRSQTIQLSFGIYTKKSLKRKAENAPGGAPVLKKRLLPSATPQLQAFFNSHISPKTVKELAKPKTPLKPTLNKSFEIQPKIESKVSSFDSSCSNNNESVKQEHKTFTSQHFEEKVKPVEKSPGLPAVDEKPLIATIKKIDDEEDKNSLHQSDCFQKSAEKTVDKELDLPKVTNGNLKPDKLDDSEQLTTEVGNEKTFISLERPYNTSTHSQTLKPKANSFVQIQPKPDAIQRSQKPENLQCYTMLNIPVDEAVRSKPPTPVEIPVVLTKPKRPENIQSFVNHHSVNDVMEANKQVRNRRKPSNPSHFAQNPFPGQDGKIRIPANQRSGQFILLAPNSTSESKSDQSKVQVATQRNYEQLDDAQAHKVALDAVRNTMGGVLLQGKRPQQQKRPILPKTMTHTIAQNIKKSAATPAIPSNLQKQLQRTIPSTDIEDLKRLRGQQDLLNQMAAAKLSRNGLPPPPPYNVSCKASPQANTSSIQSFARNNSHPALSSQSQSAVLPITTNQGATASHAPREMNTAGAAIHHHLPRTLSTNQQSSGRTAVLKPIKNLSSGPTVIHDTISTRTPQRSFSTSQVSPRNQSSNQSSLRNQIASSSFNVTNRNSPNNPMVRHSVGNHSFVRHNLTNQNLVSPCATNHNLQRKISLTSSNVRSLERAPVASPQKFSRAGLPVQNSIGSIVSAQKSNRNGIPITGTSQLTLANQNNARGSSIANHIQGRYESTKETKLRPSSPNAIIQPHNFHDVQGRARHMSTNNLKTIHQTNRPIPPAVKTLLQQKKPAILRHQKHDKKKPNILRKSPVKPSINIAVPPAGTRSPWSSRMYPLPETVAASEEISAAKKPKHSTPPPAHQHHSINLKHIPNLKSVPNFVDAEMPLELTAKSPKPAPVVPFVVPASASSVAPTSQTDDQPLCLVKKKS